MEDFIKDKLSGYQPTFKESYWTEMSHQLNKRRKRKLLLFWLWGGLSLGVIALMIFAGINISDENKSLNSVTQQANVLNEQVNPNAKSSNQAPTSNRTNSKDNNNSPNINSKYATIQFESSKPPKTNEGQESKTRNEKLSSKKSMLDDDQHNISNKHFDAAKSPSNVRDDTKLMATSSITNKNQNPIDIKAHTYSRANKNDAERDHASKDLTSHNEQIEESQTNVGLVNKANETESTDQRINLDLDALALLKTPAIDIHTSLETLPVLKSVTITTIQHPFNLPKNGVNMASNILSSSQNTLIKGQEIQARRYFELDKNSLLYASVGLGGAHYSGKFDAIDYEKVSYRSFAQNSISQSLIPEHIYTIAIPLEIGIRVSKWRIGYYVTPEWILSVDGNIVTEEEMKKVIAMEMSGVPNGFLVSSEVVSSTKPARLAQTNIQSTTFSSGLSVNYRLGRQWMLGLSGQYYFSGLFTLKRTILDSNSLSGKNKIKGGLHVSYLF